MRHSVTLDLKKCRGCTTCIKSCPTEAIRVRSGKATILPNRCIDCGTCFQVCPHQAVQSAHSDFYMLQRFQYNIAVPDPALYAQFHHMDNIDIVLNGLLSIGFDDVYESAAAAELLADCLDHRTGDGTLKPELSPACPAVVRLICIRFPDLLGHIAPVITPLELAAILARRRAVEATGLPPEEIGVFTIVPCTSQLTAAAAPEGLKRQVVDGAFAIRDIYLALLEPMRQLDMDNLRPMAAGAAGVSWAFAGGEALSRRDKNYIAVDGINNVIRMLEEIEDGRMPEADFIELRACTQGCLGGCLNVENPFTARMRLKGLMSNLSPFRPRTADRAEVSDILDYTKKPEFLPTFQLDSNRRRAMEKMRAIQKLEEQLPGLRCGSCGAPSCRAFAEDVVMGRASEDDCIFKVRERMQHVAGRTGADEYLPAPFRRHQEDAPSGLPPLLDDN